ncbi:VIT1/CCC1 transporter family protein [uncultured Tenacibaculum sp.]|uniref:VIT1/CCC1 transporter family protein n=1 Tax=uncultured Tenacibaculum sp. TaxID=174713 RepID=UPI00261CF3C5|nr:VIT1/CCC1 transporter family protein [uncultured Tenacibaculum sp.]
MIKEINPKTSIFLRQTNLSRLKKIFYDSGYYISGFPGNLFIWTSILTSLAFIFIGFFKTYITQTSKLKGILETVILGMFAATVSYFVSDIIEGIITG